jgi:hypothetical protein
MKSFSERLMYFIENQLHISVREFEKNVNLPQGSIQRAINGTNMGIDKLQMISQHYPKLNMDWLIGGEGSMFEPENLDNNSDPIENKELNIINHIPVTEGDKKAILMQSILNLTESNKTLAESVHKAIVLNEKMMDKIDTLWQSVL